MFCWNGHCSSSQWSFLIRRSPGSKVVAPHRSLSQPRRPFIACRSQRPPYALISNWEQCTTIESNLVDSPGIDRDFYTLFSDIVKTKVTCFSSCSVGSRGTWQLKCYSIQIRLAVCTFEKTRGFTMCDRIYTHTDFVNSAVSVFSALWKILFKNPQRNKKPLEAVSIITKNGVLLFRCSY